MEDEQLLRYSRQIMLPDLGYEGQQRLLDSHVMLIGLGGLGSPVALYLAAAGIGQLTLVDFDAVDLSNLQRQIIHRGDSIGRPKVESARDALNALNPECRINTVERLLEPDELASEVAKVDLVVDASDNFATRFSINAACVQQRKPLVSGAAIRWEGQVTVFGNQPGGACYHCLYDEDGEEDESCSDNGVLAPVVGIIGAIQATETIKQLTGTGQTLEGRLLVLDGLKMEWRTLKIKRDKKCPVCSTR